MHLLIGNLEDDLVAQIYMYFESRSYPTMIVSEEMLFNQSQFALIQNNIEIQGYIFTNGINIPFQELSSVYVRPRRSWTPSNEFDDEDHEFVFHETIAAWVSLLSSLPCPVVNRFDLGWWLGDPVYLLNLRNHIASLINIDSKLSEYQDEKIVCSKSYNDPICNASIYLAGKQLIPQSNLSANLLMPIEQYRSVLFDWQRATQTWLIRLDFVLTPHLSLVNVEPFPNLNEESPELTKDIVMSLTEILYDTNCWF